MNALFLKTTTALVRLRLIETSKKSSILVTRASVILSKEYAGSTVKSAQKMESATVLQSTANATDQATALSAPTAPKRRSALISTKKESPAQSPKAANGDSCASTFTQENMENA